MTNFSGIERGEKLRSIDVIGRGSEDSDDGVNDNMVARKKTLPSNTKDQTPTRCRRSSQL